MLTPAEMDQVRDLIWYSAKINQSSSTLFMLLLAGATSIGAWFVNRWSSRRHRGACPLCKAPRVSEPTPTTSTEGSP